MTIVLVGHLPGEGYFQSDLYNVVPILCDTPFAYWEGMARAWDADETFVHLDHDMEVTDDLVDDLFDCPEPLCTWSYRLHWASSGVPEGVSAQRWVHGDYCTYTGLGFIKVSPSVRTGPLKRVPWAQVEQSVNAAVSAPWHMHRPDVPHHHW